MQERVVAAAIKFYMLDENNQKEKYETIMTDRRHADVFYKMKQLHIKYDKPSHTQGFWTSENRFVDRCEAKEIAIAANQLIVPLEETFVELYSEDVW